MPWIYALVGLIIGAILGMVICRLTTPGYKKQKSVQKDLDNAKFELEQQKQELADHFAQAAEMLDSLGKEYTKLYQHMAKTSAELLPNLPEQDNPFVKKAAQATENNASEQDNLDAPHSDENQGSDSKALTEAPKDYASGSTGLLKDKKKEMLDSQDVVSAKTS